MPAATEVNYFSLKSISYRIKGLRAW